MIYNCLTLISLCMSFWLGASSELMNLPGINPDIYKNVYAKLPNNTRAILEQVQIEQKRDPNSAWVIKIDPASISNFNAAVMATLKKYRKPHYETVVAQLVLTTMARVYQDARAVVGRKMKKGVMSGILSVDISALIEQAQKNPSSLNRLALEVDDEGKVELSKAIDFNLNEFSKFSLSDIPGNNIALIGIGGGSDGIQATQLASILPSYKKVAAVMSVRNLKKDSTEAKAMQGYFEKKSPERIIAPGVYLMALDDDADYLKEFFSSKRFFENLPAEFYPAYLIIEETTPDKQRTPQTDASDRENLIARLEAALNHAQANSVIAVDTGGDALFPKKLALGEQGKTTPDQDLRVLEALSAIGKQRFVMTAEIAVGVDSPTNAQEILLKGKARYYKLTQPQVNKVLEQYKAWFMDGKTDNDRYGKTSLTWQAALQGFTDLYVLPLPKKVVVDPKNPWIPFVLINPAMANIFFMKSEDHLKAIS